MNYIYVLISFSSIQNVIYVRMYVFFKNSSIGIWYVFSNFIFCVLIEQRFKIEVLIQSLLQEIFIFYRLEKDIYVDRFFVNNVNKFF